jgi:ubiquinone/menaquinone biosynthesis C-methylase UbiE
VLAAHFDRVVAFDMAPQMLAHASQVAETVPLRLLADASRMPFRAGVANAVVCINMFLFPEEVDRVLRSDGALIFVSTIGADTPIYLQPGDVLDALPGSWDGTTSDACWGTWTVARRS